MAALFRGFQVRRAMNGLRMANRAAFCNTSGRTCYDDRRDYVFVEDLVFHGYHGDLKEEKVLGQKFQISVNSNIIR